MAQDHFEEVFEQYRRQLEEKSSINPPEGNSSLEYIVAVRKNDDGDLIAFKTNSGRELDYIQALNEAKQGLLAHVDIFHKYGRDILKSEPDGIKENNFVQLPLF
ncbi:DUF3892 domain-containing protein [Halalkalibacter alkalisediminis]|uniref:DUF3892 domain-containing protein n=1 Tax=Halalkalibacter alkalisediminis TaxID=935616 RepID=A0ABV6NFS8_9BACI|nr:DUF3892 domain-containing protein [Halalkalibacter alkalisediminis]